MEAAARMIAEVANQSKIVVEKSTVPVKAAESISNILKANQRLGVQYQVQGPLLFPTEKPSSVGVKMNTSQKMKLH